MTRTSSCTRPLIDDEDAEISDPSTGSRLVSFEDGTGLTLYRDVLLPAMLQAQHEVILVTCFWAQSETLERLISTLKQLSQKADGRRPIRVHICFSSRSALQKLFHTSSKDGYTYPPHTWTSKLGLPHASDLPGLDITVKSLFFRPFSVLHSKFMIVDRKRVFFPSCNVSWEDWFECCVGVEGSIVQDTCSFFDRIWRPTETTGNHELDTVHETNSEGFGESLAMSLLPHPHHSALRYALWLLPNALTSYPSTPLNLAVRRLITNAKSDVIVLTPNFTSEVAFWSICFALRMGVDVHLLTNRRMMVPEQLVTAGTITEFYVDKLIKVYQAGLTGQRVYNQFHKHCSEVSGQRFHHMVQSESNLSDLGRLKVSYFRPSVRREHGQDIDVESGMGKAHKADKSHIKLTLVDRDTIVLGSGNMDRASWVTSQELGILIKDLDQAGRSSGLVEKFWLKIEKGLEGCLETYFPN